MISTQLSTISHVVQGQLLGADSIISSVSTDTRRIEPEGLFIALVGERFDAHQFAQQAIDAGAKALLVERALAVDVAQIVVSNTKQALGQLGCWVHQQCQTPTIAITGSCGKTTVKEMVASILSAKGQVLYTAGNFNNDIGVPLTLLRSSREDDFAVIELGANHIGEIAYTTQLVKPDVALVNNVAAAHLEGFGSIDGVKQAKGEIYQGLAPGKTALVNLDSHGGELWSKVLADKQVKTFSVNQQNADFFASQIALNQAGEASFTLHTPQGEQPVTLGIIGQHNVSNALAASALAMEMGASIQEVAVGLAQLSAVKGRVDVSLLTPMIRLIDDSYNASVPAMKAAIELLASFSGCRWLILGNMAELGTESLALHQQVGEHAAPFQFDYVLTYGEDARVISQQCQGQHFSTHQDMLIFIAQQLEVRASQSHVLLVKGANSSGMSKIVAALKEKFS
ncbi:UDP-N-acetylmuramoyl-tripeptide--D-alanyl-D-alanine ligase [Vibrio metschnikovii]|uniref:UDP-N-acetylmuramoyl-tripeptide--D-alanyl-D- alanine ligase n=1 Tax=Vibrio metschnikovii TaxID=28172 RepID=UPI001C30374E|nr:UDP-N-acetylmuramoyl-tripeptide--D-alanyl-D-alanine ligase [Vibrio metschnikovii]EKO3571625.1 UDP-N-acetylmuramoyl-tripeptide--D-alanyl-D-alanine ligase [Vibrio metschnikovii]EKO3675971.1 UDP-N-acetylmuramoyl-tripeptide--D-alanyl-D-alanine ligase [Vibrio metschnikovii]EKO3780873.1 UDP-N-acetylmuramoyl-tripeptide--D-alanyl-D-alanine ligase [Vibrio metschnikovii]EKO3885800.1 UDP-N-acetylmuramoyl-tripeptide--D-alanyl-D-alanine ligase [Vibrio metschnikovii]EKO3934274.1 UDP-N-acetylmuramoyl-trip